MKIAARSANFIVAFFKSYGPSTLKKYLWDREFAGPKWEFINHTEGDCVYENLEKYTNNGSLLDLGCGPGNTANELCADAYQRYMGIDISEEALAKAQRRTAETGRGNKNLFVHHDFINYTPTQEFDVILFRESIYHVPIGKIKDTLDHYAKYLKPNGVLMIRIATSDEMHSGVDKPRPMAMVRLMEREFDVVEERRYDHVTRPMVLVLRPKKRN
jgi:2-polyprenyl-3-methyl-5-hydroxy-6-metoxy-1,4-benzoquinol methylase